MVEVSVVLLESSSSIAKVSLLVMILESLLSYILLMISSDSKSYHFFSYHNMDGKNLCAVLGMFHSVVLRLCCFP